MVSPEGIVRLQPGQRCHLLFKFFSFRDSCWVPTDEANLFISPHTIQVKIYHSNGNLFRLVKVQILPRVCPVDQVLRFEEPEDSVCNLVLPDFIQPYSNMISSHPLAWPNIVGDRINVGVKTGRHGDVFEFKLVMGDDPAITKPKNGIQKSAKEGWQVYLIQIKALALHWA